MRLLNFAHAATVALILAGCCTSAVAAEFYVAPDGNDAAAGTSAEPFASLERAQEAVRPGDTVWIRGGVYEFSGTDRDIGVLFDKSGTADAPIRYFAHENETPAFDFFKLRTVARIRGFSVRADHLHLRGLEVRGVQQIITDVNESWGIRVEDGADHNIFERLDLHHNEGPGLFIADGGHNLVLDCDSHHNHDPDRGGENADGFGSHSNDDGNVFRGNRAWANSDDGYDFINSPGVVRIENCWAFRNGFVPDTDEPAGNGAGFKAGGFGLDPDRFPDDVPRHEVVGNVAFGNRTQGFYTNHHPGGTDVPQQHGLRQRPQLRHARRCRPGRSLAPQQPRRRSRRRALTGNRGGNRCGIQLVEPRCRTERRRLPHADRRRCGRAARGRRFAAEVGLPASRAGQSAG